MTTAVIVILLILIAIQTALLILSRHLTRTFAEAYYSHRRYSKASVDYEAKLSEVYTDAIYKLGALAGRDRQDARGRISDFLQSYYSILHCEPLLAGALLELAATQADELPDEALLGLLRFSLPHKAVLPEWGNCREQAALALSERHGKEDMPILLEGLPEA